MRRFTLLLVGAAMAALMLAMAGAAWAAVTPPPLRITDVSPDGAVGLERQAVVGAAGEGLYVRGVQTAADPDRRVAVGAGAASPVSELAEFVLAPGSGELLDGSRRGDFDAYRERRQYHGEANHQHPASPRPHNLACRAPQHTAHHPCARSLVGRREKWPAVPLHPASAAYS